MICTGRGKKGDQRLEGPNRDVAENRKQLFVLEAVHSKHLEFLVGPYALLTGSPVLPTQMAWSAMS